jgi:hypothetical protein
VNYNKLENVPNEKYYFTDKGDIRLSLSFCPSCKIMYKIGCLHNIDQNAYNGHLISKWIDLTTNEEYCGMPQFQDENEWFEKANNIKILEFVCPNGSLACHNKKSGICHDIIDMNDKCKNNK